MHSWIKFYKIKTNKDKIIQNDTHTSIKNEVGLQKKSKTFQRGQEKYQG